MTDLRVEAAAISGLDVRLTGFTPTTYPFVAGLAEAGNPKRLGFGHEHDVDLAQYRAKS